MNSLTNIVRVDKVIRLRGEEMAIEAGFKGWQLYTRSQKHKLTIIRGAMMYHLRFSCSYSLREVGEVFNRTPSAISYWSNKLSDLAHIGDEEAMRYIDYIKP
tara:strand:- start:406 stop:711 length:306 start_codon:yes stop_codon:yes gene_type:complete